MLLSSCCFSYLLQGNNWFSLLYLFFSLVLSVAFFLGAACGVVAITFDLNPFYL